ncbi:MAG: 4Fe-4S dicluster domain-containing protein [bacterium]
MSTTHILEAKDLAAFLDALAQRYRVVAPVREEELIDFRVVESPDQVLSHRDYIVPRGSVKRYFFPRSEPLIAFDRTKEGVEVEDPELDLRPTLIYGCRPCDAASLPIMDALYDWDYRDSFWFQRREATTVVAVSCVRADQSCFCTALGGSPCGTAGSDLLLTPLDEERWLAEVLTPKGQGAVDAAGALFAEGEGDKEQACRPALEILPPKLDLDDVARWLAENFEDQRWPLWSYKCWGCGCCTFLCPTCHCFDIVDEGGYRHGQRRRNWDACQFAQFTLHASGHNPRPHQAARWRQRVEHKFHYYVEKFGYRSCVGCGRCIRHCPVNMDIHAQLVEMAELARGAEPAAATD